MTKRYPQRLGIENDEIPDETSFEEISDEFDEEPGTSRYKARSRYRPQDKDQDYG